VAKLQRVLGETHGNDARNAGDWLQLAEGIDQVGVVLATLALPNRQRLARDPPLTRGWIAAS